MVEFDSFRQNLATLLLCQADRRRQSAAEGRLTGEDLKVVALLERLARDCENLDLHVFLICRLMFTHRHLARRFLQRRDHLLAQVGVIAWPSDATELVRWMMRNLIDDEEDRSVMINGDRSAATRPVGPVQAPPAALRPAVRSRAPGAFATAARDLTAGFGIVAPLLALWEVKLGIGQWRDQAAAQAGTAVPATVISSEPVRGGRSGPIASKVVLTFQPTPAASACQVAARVSGDPSHHAAGTTVMVVPRSPACEPPLVVAAIGDPAITFVLAAGLMAGGLGALKLWSRLGRPRRRASRERPFAAGVRAGAVAARS